MVIHCFDSMLVSAPSLYFLADSAEKDVEAFIKEIEIMKFIGKHKNVIQLYATSTYNGKFPFNHLLGYIHC